jgi:NAD(P)-dependent dehydrogenase (short-subunit alcohol dehydrogenase family)
MTALVTGAAGAIGSAIVRQLIALGEEVIAQDLSAEALSALPSGTLTLAGDLLDPDLAARLRGIIGGRGVRRVIAAHGIDGSGSLSALAPDRFRRVMSINAESVVDLFGIARPALAVARGSFVVVASQAGLVAEPDNAAYSASKFALVGWASRMRALVEPEGIRIRVTSPGCTETPLFLAAQAGFAAANGTSLDAFLQHRIDRIPVGRFGTTEQTASTAVYLSDPSFDTPFMLAATGGETRH